MDQAHNSEADPEADSEVPADKSEADQVDKEVAAPAGTPAQPDKSPSDRSVAPAE